MIQLVKNVKLIYITRTRFQLLLTIYRCKLVTFFFLGTPLQLQISNQPIIWQKLSAIRYVDLGKTIC